MEQFLTIFSEYLSKPEVVTAIGVLTVIYLIFLIFLSVLWCILPFAVFGTKKRLREIIGESQKTNELLEEMVKETQKINTWLAEIMSESKRTTAWLAEMKTDSIPAGTPEASAEVPGAALHSQAPPGSTAPAAGAALRPGDSGIPEDLQAGSPRPALSRRHAVERTAPSVCSAGAPRRPGMTL